MTMQVAPRCGRVARGAHGRRLLLCERHEGVKRRLGRAVDVDHAERRHH
eukprot:CAMPEP_0198325518 /NCGR_PEP_ID=MMETSP1450-20131203/13254_1 /TAXON_ID=753684 ORGANISM="Madagascaria erythrocladiodes, Strain CCMP3234" /NCGR_SAMPLE_ID=MMETSP1450 /ASSEMBLY_ACC=CAM_ASM_001115 /LENGTH=48 /DNA_ID= /DNA_START= /DNA_END= /DNA_ORIENTATION=